jgi:hypothetical protein
LAFTCRRFICACRDDGNTAKIAVDHLAKNSGLSRALGIVDSSQLLHRDTRGDAMLLLDMLGGATGGSGPQVVLSNGQYVDAASALLKMRCLYGSAHIFWIRQTSALQKMPEFEPGTDLRVIAAAMSMHRAHVPPDTYREALLDANRQL